jgi:hypothetical protein
MTATQELVVPRSMPIILGIRSVFSPRSGRRVSRPRRDTGEGILRPRVVAVKNG